MAWPQIVTDQQLLQACTDLHGTGKPVTVRGVHAVTGGDLKRIAKVVDEFKAQNGLDPLAAANQPHAVPTRMEDLPDALRQCVTDSVKGFERNLVAIAVASQQTAAKGLEAEKQVILADAQAARDDRDYANHQHDLLAEKYRQLEQDLEVEREGRRQDQGAHAQALKDAQDAFAEQLEQMRTQFESQIETARQQADAAVTEAKTQAVTVQKQYEIALEEKGQAEAMKETAARRAVELQSELDKSTASLREAIVAQARADGAVLRLKDELEVSGARMKRMDDALAALQEQMLGVAQSIGRLTEQVGKMDVAAGQIGGLHDQVSEVLAHVEALMGQSALRPAAHEPKTSAHAQAAG